ncbi:FAD-dependent oxidoreductase [Amycolatopsis sp. CA-230715]|uniref:FAD-dependent oxidoreductase n=1 Tax=Amycolatopsis sp. CA-230715 TaxID=2745196 RepID=UPI001C01ED88|nr:NAD(P)/FAD-dependent oxidoreductase [Amycolatopsis sp. CA-230715]QWF84174.1 Kynurenine 3-monooxygenase [Amycolatopsis sp. CA-230715]
MPPHVIVIGAGTGGLCLAQGLRQAGVSVAVYERDQTREDGLFGYRVGIDPDGSRALAACLPEDLFQVFVATKAETPRFMNIFTEKRAELLRMGEWDTPEPSDPIDSEKSISRMTLRQVLLTGIEDIVHFGKEFVRYHQNADDTVTAHFADGSTARGDLLVAADGSSSAVRRQYLPHASMDTVDAKCVTAKLPLNAESRSLLTPEMLRGVTMINAPGGYACIIHVMEFKWDRDGTLKNDIGGNDSALLSTWPGLKYDNTRDYVMWGWSAPGKRLPADFMRLPGDELRKIVLEHTKDWHPRFRALFEAADPTTAFPLQVRTTTPLKPWPTSTITLLGDAIHTMTPGLGVGANTALRDAENLVRQLVIAHRGEKPLVDAVRAYEAEMHSYAWELVRKSKSQFGGNLPLDKPVIGRALLAGMRTGLRAFNHMPNAKRKAVQAMEKTRGHRRRQR